MKHAKNFLLLLTTFSICLFTIVCGGQELSPKHRPNFKTQQIKVAGKKIVVEIADTEEKREFGLMFKKSLSPDSGMLFIFDGPQTLRFWMKNTLIPLSIAYFSADKKIVKILEMEPASPMVRYPETYPSGAPAQYALEMNPGWFKKNKIGLGAILETEQKK